MVEVVVTLAWGEWASLHDVLLEQEHVTEQAPGTHGAELLEEISELRIRHLIRNPFALWIVLPLFGSVPSAPLSIYAP